MQRVGSDAVGVLGAQADKGHRDLALVRVGAAHHGRAQHRRVARQQHLQLGREHAHAAHLEHLLAPPQEMQVARLVIGADIAGAEPAVAEHLGIHVGAAPVALEQRRRADYDLAFRTDRQHRAGVEVADLDARARHRQADKDRAVAQVHIVVLHAGREGVAGMGLGHAPGAFGNDAAGQRVPALADVGGDLADERGGARVLQRTQVVAAAFGVVHQLDRVVHHHEGAVDTIALDRGHHRHRIPARQQHHGRAAEDRIDQPEVLARDPEHRQEIQHHVVGAFRQPLRIDTAGERVRSRRGVDHVALRVHAALGQAGGAAGVVQCGQRVHVDRGQRGRLGVAQCLQQVDGACHGQRGRVEARWQRQLGLRRQHRAGTGGVDGAQPRLRAHRHQQRRKLVLHDDGGGAGIVQLIDQLLFLEERVDRHIHRAQLQDAVEDHVELRAVAHHHRHPVARAHAAALEQRGAALGQVVEFGVGHGGAVPDQRGVVRALARPRAQVIAQRGLAMGVDRCVGQAGGPDLAMPGFQVLEERLFVHLLSPLAFALVLFAAAPTRRRRRCASDGGDWRHPPRAR
ncbi:hypothetical protein D9M72_379390 [compost metagenome]